MAVTVTRLQVGLSSVNKSRTVAGAGVLQGPSKRQNRRRMLQDLRPAVGRRWLLVLAAALVLPGDVARAAEPDPAAEVDRRTTSFEYLFAVWDSCGEEPTPGQVCTVTAIDVHRVMHSNIEDGPPVEQGLAVSRSSYTVGENGEPLLNYDESWYGEGPVELSVDRSLSTATATAVVDVKRCGLDGETDCGDATHQVSASWTATDDEARSRDQTRRYSGVLLRAARTTVNDRPAVASGTVDGGELGESVDAIITAGESRDMRLYRNGAFRALRSVIFPTFVVLVGGPGHQVWAQWSTCGDATMPGDVCTETRIQAYESSLFGYESRLTVGRVTYAIDENGEKRQGASWFGFGPLGELTVDRQLSTATASGVVESTECRGGGDGPPQDGPPPDGPPPPLECRVVSHDISGSWTATDKVARTGDMRIYHDGNTRAVEHGQNQFRPAVATATLDGEDLGETEPGWAHIIRRRETGASRTEQ